MKKSKIYLTLVGKNGLPNNEFKCVEGYVEEFKTSDGGTIKLGFDKTSTSFCRVTEMSTGVRCDTNESQNFTTYKDTIKFFNDNKDLIDLIHSKLSESPFCDVANLLQEYKNKNHLD